MNEKLLSVIGKMKILTLCTAVSVIVFTVGFAAFSVCVFTDYRLPIPLPFHAAIYSLLVVTFLFAIVQMIKIYSGIPDNIETTLKSSLKKLDIAYIIIFALSVYAVITIGLNQILTNGGSDSKYFGGAMAALKAELLEIFAKITMVVAFVPLILIFVINLIIAIVIAVKFDSYYITPAWLSGGSKIHCAGKTIVNNKVRRNLPAGAYPPPEHPRLTKYFEFVSATKAFFSAILLFSVIPMKVSPMTLSLLIFSAGSAAYSVFIILLIRYYDKLAEIQKNPTIVISQEFTDTDVIGYEDPTQYANNNYDI